ncbi:MAG: DUF11 domain-containing protein, partial [Gammaproteobacteria bacterium]|nr:DUF11 domain-containing protein [Gammaproteobacteria bacterium]
MNNNPEYLRGESNFEGFNLALDVTDTQMNIGGQSVAARKLKATNPSGKDSFGDAMFAALNVNTVDVQLKSNGGLSVSIGIIDAVDGGDAPQTYDEGRRQALHQVIPRLEESMSVGHHYYVGPNAKEGETNQDGSSVVEKLPLVLEPLLKIGEAFDYDLKSHYSDDATGDNKAGKEDANGVVIDDEGSVSSFVEGCEGTIGVVNATDKVAYLHYWIDINEDGKFDYDKGQPGKYENGNPVNFDKEYGRIEVPADYYKTGANGEKLPKDVKFEVKEFFAPGETATRLMRFRLTPEEEIYAYGTADGGEIEDELVTFLKPKISGEPVVIPCGEDKANVTIVDLPRTTASVIRYYTGTFDNDFPTVLTGATLVNEIQVAKPSDPTQTVSQEIQNLTKGKYKFVVTQIDEDANETSCPSVFDMEVFENPKTPTLEMKTAGDLIFCQGETPTELTDALKATNPVFQGSELKWYTTTTDTPPAETATGSATMPTIDTSTAGTTYYWVTRTAGTKEVGAKIDKTTGDEIPGTGKTVNLCESEKLKIKVVVQPLPTQPTVSVTKLAGCDGTGATVSITNADITKYDYFIKKGTATEEALTVATDGTTTYTYEEGASYTVIARDKTKTVKCDNPSDEFTIKKACIELKKASADITTATVGANVTYTFTVTNTGTSDLENIKVVDEKIFKNKTPQGLDQFTGVAETSSGKWDGAKLKAGGVITFTKNYPLTQDDIDAGVVENTATVTGTDEKDENVTDTSDSTNTGDDDKGGSSTTDKGDDNDPTNDPTKETITRTAGIELEKTSAFSPATATAPNGEISYTFKVKNTGNVTLTNPTIVDEKLFGNTTAQAIFDTAIFTIDAGKSADYDADPTKKTILPNGYVTITAVAKHKVVQKDLDAGKVENTAKTTAEVPTGVTPPKDTSDSGNTNDKAGTDDPTIELLTQSPAFTLKKGSVFNDTNNDGIAQVGETITYTFVVTNTGNVTLTNVEIKDTGLKSTVTIVPDANNPTKLLPTKTATFTAVYTLTQTDIDAGLKKNVATAKATPPNDAEGNAVTPIETTSDSSNQNDTDEEFGKDDTKKADQDTDPNNDPTFTTLPRKAGIELEKKSVFDTANASAEGDEITYTFKVTNTGNVTLTNPTIADDKLFGTEKPNIFDDTKFEIVTAESADYDATAKTISPNGYVTITAKTKYALTEADLDAGKVVNTAETTADVPAGMPASAKPTDTSDSANTGDDDKGGNSTTDKGDDGDTTNDPTVTPLKQNPEITLKKSSSVPTGAMAGDLITYTFTLENTGNVTVKDLTITDTKLGLSGVDVTTLAGFTATPTDKFVTATKLLKKGGVLTFTATYELKQSDFNVGKVVNTAEANGTDPQNNPVSDTSDSANQGKNGEDIDDDTTGANADETLDGENGKKLGKDGDATNDPTVSLLSPTPNIELTKSIKTVKKDVTGKSDRLEAGDQIVYEFKVTNTGNVTLTDVVIKDDKLGLTGAKAISVGTLEPAKKGTPAGFKVVTATYTLIQEDIDKGKVANTATTEGELPEALKELLKTQFPDGKVKDTSDSVDKDGNPANNDGGADADSTIEDPNDATKKLGNDTDATNDPTVLELTQDPKIELEKKADKTKLVVGEKVTYTFTATNKGNVTLTDVVVTDPLDDLSAVTPAKAETLAVGASATFTATYVVKQSDVDAGVLKNTATVTANDPKGTPQTAEAKNTITDGKTGAIEIEKTADKKNLVVGETVTYTFKVTNTSKVTLTDVVVTDPLTDLSAVTPATVATLVPGASENFTATYVVKQTDVDAGELNNTATVTANDPKGTEVTDKDDVTIKVVKTDYQLVDGTQAPIEDVEGTHETRKDGEIIKGTDNKDYIVVESVDPVKGVKVIKVKQVKTVYQLEDGTPAPIADVEGSYVDKTPGTVLEGTDGNKYEVVEEVDPVSGVKVIKVKKVKTVFQFKDGTPAPISEVDGAYDDKAKGTEIEGTDGKKYIVVEQVDPVKGVKVIKVDPVKTVYQLEDGTPAPIADVEGSYVDKTPGTVLEGTDGNKYEVVEEVDPVSGVKVIKVKKVKTVFQFEDGTPAPIADIEGSYVDKTPGTVLEGTDGNKYEVVEEVDPVSGVKVIKVKKVKTVYQFEDGTPAPIADVDGSYETHKDGDIIKGTDGEEYVVVTSIDPVSGVKVIKVKLIDKKTVYQFEDGTQAPIAEVGGSYETHNNGDVIKGTDGEEYEVI